MLPVLLIDAGNTRTTVAVCDHARFRKIAELETARTGDAAARSDLRRKLAVTGSVEAVYCSVVPAVDRRWLRLLRAAGCRRLLKVGSGIELGMGVKYPKPRTIGADRLAAASGAVGKYGSPAIVADFGTATTFDVVDAQGRFVGGAIAPGFPLMTEYLHLRTALLPKVSLGGTRARGIGRSTTGAIRVGAAAGYAGMVHGITAHLRRAAGFRKAVLCATGGYAARVLAGLNGEFVLDPDLLFRGLWRIYKLNRERGRSWNDTL